MDYEKLSDRKKRILSAVIDSYIDSAEPVSSGEIREKYVSDISSATIRSELATLEEMGFLIQPHTSAGRIPSTEAYRFYVDKLLQDKALTPEELAIIQDCFKEKVTEVDDVIRRTAKVISDITNYTSVILVDNVGEVKLRTVKLVDIGDDVLLVVIVTDSGIISDKTIVVDHSVSEDYLAAANAILNKVFCGKRLKDIISTEPQIDEAVGEYKALFDEILRILSRYCKGNDHRLFLEGTNNMFDQTGVQATKNFLSLISHENKLADIIKDNDIEFSVKIGDADNGLEHCAMVTATYTIDGKKEMKAGVIGPDRMDYSKVKAVLDYIGKIINGLN